MDVDLSLVALEHLLKEINSRFETYLFCCTKNLGKEGTQTIAYSSKDPYAALGLAVYSQKRILNFLEKQIDKEYDPKVDGQM